MSDDVQAAIARSIGQLAGQYQVAKMFGETQRQAYLGIALAGALTVVRSIGGPMWDGVRNGLSMDELEMAEVMDLMPLSEDDVNKIL